jgi:translocation and assembly module TamB
VPDANRFDADVKLEAPASGLLATLMQWQPGMTLNVNGKGTFAAWRGRLLANTENVDAISAELALDDGTLSVDGNLIAPRSINPRLAKAITLLPALSATARYKDSSLSTAGKLSGVNAMLAWKGTADLKSNLIETASVSLNDPDGVFATLADPALKSQSLHLDMIAKGDLRTPSLDAKIKSKKLTWKKYSIDDATISAQTPKFSTQLPLQLSFSGTNGRTGFAWLDPKLGKLNGSGQISISNRGLSASKVQVRGNDLSINGMFSTAFATGAWQASVDTLTTRIDAGANGTLPISLKGKATASSAQTPIAINAFGSVGMAAWRGPKEVVRLFGQTPVFSAVLSILPSGETRASALSLDGNGSRFAGQMSLANGIIDARLNGTIKSLATLSPDLPFTVAPNVPVALTLKGSVENPAISAELQTPLLQVAGTELRTVALQLQPAGQSKWQVSLTGQGAFGALDAKAQIQTSQSGIGLRNLTGTAGPAKITGDMDIDQSGLATGTASILLAQTGQEFAINAKLSPQNSIQKINAVISGNRISQKWNGQPVTVENIDGDIQALMGKTPAIETKLSIRNAIWTDWQLGSLTLNGGGPLANFNANYTASGIRGSPFNLSGTVKTQGSTGLPNVIEATATGSIANRPFRLTTPARVVRIANGWQLGSTELNYAGGKINVSGAQRGTSLEATLDLSNTNLELLNLIKPDLNLTGIANGKTSLQLQNGKLTGFNGTMALKRVRRAGLFQASLPLDVAGTMNLTGPQIQSQITLRANGRDAGGADIRISRTQDGGFATGGLAGSVNYDGPAEALWGLIGVDANDVRGKLLIKASLAGTVSDPLLRGTASLRDGRYENVALGLIVTALGVDGVFDGSQLSFENAQASFPAGGTISAKGKVDVSAERGFPALINLSLNRAAVLKRDDLDIVATGQLVATYGPKGGKVSGPLTINQARIRAGGATSQSISEVEVREINKPLDPKSKAQQRRITKPFELDLDISAREKIFVSGLGLNSEWSGDVHATGTTSIPRLTGQMSLIRGTYEFANRRFNVDRGSIIFQGTTPINPVINIRATTRAGDRDIIIQVNGTAGAPDIRFTASPSLPQDEVLSRLLFGSSIQELSPLEAVQLATALNQLSSNGGGLNVIGSVKRVTGIDRLRVLPADRAKGASTALSGGKYLTDRIYVEVATDGRGYTATTIEYDITRTLSVLSEIATLGGTNIGVKYSKEY